MSENDFINDTELSIIIPVYNEEDSIMFLYEKIEKVCNSLNVVWEIVFVDDGSKDRTVEILRELRSSDHRVKIIIFRKNFGQTAAMSAGFDYAKGDVVISMDGDLQNDPEDIPKLLKQIDNGYDVVCGWRKQRKDKLITRKIPSVIANRLISLLTGVKIHDNGCSLKAFKPSVIKNLHLYSEMHRFIPAMAAMAGAKITEIVVNHHARQFGSTKYGLSRVWRVFLDLFTIKMLLSFSSRPALWFGLISMPIFAGALIFLAMALFSYTENMSNVASFIVYPSVSFLLFSLVVQLNTMGVFAELVLRTGESVHIESMEELQ